MIKEFLKAVWNFLVELGKHRYKKSSRYGWY